METLWEKLQFWKKKVLRENTDYRFIDFDDSDITGIEIIKGDFAGVVYHYGKARVVEEGEFARLQFGYTLVNPGNHDMDVLQNNEDFVNIMGDILTQILIKQDNESSRTLNIEEPDLQ
jgi:hypothetical protein